MNLPNVEQQPAPISTNQQRRFEKEWTDIGKFCFDTLQDTGFLQHPGISTKNSSNSASLVPYETVDLCDLFPSENGILAET